MLADNDQTGVYALVSGSRYPAGREDQPVLSGRVLREVRGQHLERHRRERHSAMRRRRLRRPELRFATGQVEGLLHDEGAGAALQLPE
jgi:hypothetical protein